MTTVSQWYIIDYPTLVVAVRAWTPVTIPSTSIIEVPQTVDGLQGLIPVKWNGEAILMFAEDIRDRGMLVSTASG